MPGRRWITWLAFLACAGTAAAQVVGPASRVLSVGFPAAGNTGTVVREGQWFPVRVALAIEGTDVFTGQLRLEALDLDGDRVAYRREITITPKPDGSPTEVTLYAAVNASNELPPTVDVLDSRGTTIARLDLPAGESVSNDCLFVLDISDRRVTKLQLLETPGWYPGQPTEGVRPYYRDIVVSPLPARDLPPHWWGLEAVDVIVWDAPNPAALRLEQLDALLEWVRCGGQLIVGVGESWNAIRGSALESGMPLAGPGPTVDAVALGTLRRLAGLPAWRSDGVERSVTLTTAGLAEGALRTVGEVHPQGLINLITMRPVGSGRVVATAATLRDLTGLLVSHEKLFGQLLDLNPYTAEFQQNAQNAIMHTLLEHHVLYDDVVRPVGFGQATALRGLTAFLFVGIYIAVATVASWWWLRGRKLSHLSWVVFGGFAVAASLLSVVTVTAMRSLSRGVQALCVVDLDAGSSAARGPCLFGYRSPGRARVRGGLPDEFGRSFLRPLAQSPRGSNRYVTPARYAAEPTRAMLDDVLMRATLKQLEGYWAGDLAGSVRGDLTVERSTGRLTEDSWLRNDLPVDVDGGYLLFCDPRQDLNGVPRAAGLTTPYPLPLADNVEENVKEVPPALNVLLVPLPKLARGQQTSRLGADVYQAVNVARQRWQTAAKRKRSDLFEGNRDLPTLHQAQLEWRRRGLGLGGDEALRGLLLASTRGLHLHCRLGNFANPDTPLRSDGLPSLDISHWLLSGHDRHGENLGQAVLLLWHEGGGPAVLHVDGEPRPAYDGLTLYRVRIPMHYAGLPPSAGEGAGP